MSLGHSYVTGIVVKYTKYVFRAPLVTGIVVKYTKYVFRAPQVTGIVVKYTKWLELSLNTPSMSLRHYVFTAPKYVFTALFHADPEVLFLICIYGITKYGGAMPKFPESLSLPLSKK